MPVTAIAGALRAASIAVTKYTRRNNTLSCRGMVHILIQSYQSLTRLVIVLLALELCATSHYNKYTPPNDNIPY